MSITPKRGKLGDAPHNGHHLSLIRQLLEQGKSDGKFPREKKPRPAVTEEAPAASMLPAPENEIPTTTCHKPHLIEQALDTHTLRYVAPDGTVQGVVHYRKSEADVLAETQRAHRVLRQILKGTTLGNKGIKIAHANTLADPWEDALHDTSVSFWVSRRSFSEEECKPFISLLAGMFGRPLTCTEIQDNNRRMYRIEGLTVGDIANMSATQITLANLAAQKMLPGRNNPQR